MSDIRETLAPILRVLKDLGGQFVFSDDEGNEFVIAGRKEFEKRKEKQGKLELAGSHETLLVSTDDEEDDITELVNQDIAMSREIDDETVDDLGLISEHPKPPTVRVKFEPLNGDISPDLQE